MSTIKSRAKRFLGILLTISMVLTIMPALAIPVFAADIDVNITNSMDAAGIRDSIQSAIDGAASGDSITVKGNKTNEAGKLALNIPGDVKVVWSAISKDLSFNITGGGTFEISAGGKIEVVGNKSIAINVVEGNVIVSGGEVSVKGDMTVAVNVKKGNVTVSGGIVSAKGDYIVAVDVQKGGVTVTGGVVLADGMIEDEFAWHSTYAISVGAYMSPGESGTVKVTGGSIIARNAYVSTFAISLQNGGLAAYLDGTSVGDFEVWGDGIIVEVESLEIPSSHGGTAIGLTPKAGKDITNVKWDMLNIIPAISYKDREYSIEWSVPTEPKPVVITDLPVLFKEIGALFANMGDAIKAAEFIGHTTYTLIILGEVTEKSDIIIKDNVTIFGAEGSHTVTFEPTGIAYSSYKFIVEGGGSLTLGDGKNDNPLTILRTIGVLDGTIDAKEGIIIKNGGTALALNGTNVNGTISGGRFEATGTDGTALDMKGGAKLSEISGGVFIGLIDAAHFSGEGTKVDLISGGSFYQIEPDVALHGHALFVQNDAEIGEISGGYFEAADNSALVVIRGGYVGEISGGVFKSLRTKHNQPDPGGNNLNATVWIETRTSEDFKGSGIGTISGGHFSGGHFGMLAITDHTNTDGFYTSRIGSITGGVFEGNIGLQVDKGSSVSTITGGEFHGSQGIFNAGWIKEIGGNADLLGNDSYGLYNWPGGVIDNISGGTITSNKDNGIANGGMIKLISGGTIIGQRSAISNDGMNKGRLEKITNGVFWGKTQTAILLAYSVLLEPDLEAVIGFGRYWGKDGVIFNNEDLVVYPVNSAMSVKYFMSYETMDVDGITEAKFKFLRLPYTVIFKPGDHGTFDEVTHSGLIPGEKTPTPPETTGEDGWVFVGWSPEISETVTGDVIYIAQWNTETPPVTYYTVIFEPGDHGTFDAVTHADLEYGDDTPEPPDTPGEDGWIFIGWEPEISDTVTGNVTYVAQWEEEPPPPPTYTVIYEPGDHGTFDAVTHDDLEYGDDTPEPPETPGEDGWIFIGWEPEVSETVTGDVTYVAQWEEEPPPPPPTYTVIYDPGEHGTFDAVTHTDLEYGDDTPEAPDTPGENGWVFIGWEPEVSEIVTEDITYVAQWHYDNGGVIIPPAPVSVTLEAKKTVSGIGATLINGQFNFAAYSNGALAATGVNDPSGNIVFSAINITQAGTYTYVMRETSTDGNGWITDHTEYTATVTVTRRSNTLFAEVTYSGGIPVFRNQYKNGGATLRISKELVDEDGKRTGNGLDFVVVLYEKAGNGGWSEVGEYTIKANGAATAIPNMQGGKTYQIVEKTNYWYNILGFEVAVDSTLFWTSNSPSIAFNLPALSQNMAIDVVVRNVQIDEPGGDPDGGNPETNPPLLDIEDDDIPLNPFITDHVAYIIGYPDGYVRPGQNVTRAETATVFFRLLTDEIRLYNWTQQNPYPDVNPGNWFNNAISVMSNMSIVKGYQDGTFRPNSAITRAELATIAARFARSMGMVPMNKVSFSDIPGHWAEDDVNYAAAIGWVAGYPDGTFKPNQPITRAEFMTLVNRMLERIPETPDDLLPDEMIKWPDNADPKAWYYLAVQEATNSHGPEYKDEIVAGLQFEYEFWTQLVENRDWSLLEKNLPILD